MNEDFQVPWWKVALRGLVYLVGLFALSGVLMLSIVGVVSFLDSFGQTEPAYTPPAAAAPPPPQRNARTSVPLPYAPEPWPSYPGRGNASRPPVPGNQVAAAPPVDADPPRLPTPPAPLVGLSVEEYQASVAAGKKVFLPDPKGECNLTGITVATFVQSLQTCFAAQAAR